MTDDADRVPDRDAQARPPAADQVSIVPVIERELAAELHALRLALDENRAILTALARSMDRRIKHGKHVRPDPDAGAVEALDDIRAIIEADLADDVRVDRIIVRLGTAPTAAGGQ